MSEHNPFTHPIDTYPECTEELARIRGERDRLREAYRDSYHTLEEEMGYGKSSDDQIERDTTYLESGDMTSD